jgi:hypothetical protein
MSTTRKPRRKPSKVSRALDAAGRERARVRRNRYQRAASLAETIAADPRFAGQQGRALKGAVRSHGRSRTVLRRMRRAGRYVGPLPRAWRYVHEQELTSEQREQLGAALHGFLANQWSGEVPYTSDIEVAYHAGYLPRRSSDLMSATEAEDVGAVFERHDISIHPDWWITDGWGDYFGKWGVKCPMCGGFSFARPADGLADGDESAATWPDKCTDCAHSLPVQHRTGVSGAGTAWFAACSCGWDPDTFSRESSAKGAATKHRNNAAR